MKFELISRTLNPLRNIFWYFRSGTTVSWTVAGSYFDYIFEDEVGQWLTTNVGRQGIHWDWRYVYVGIEDRCIIYVKLIKARQQWSSVLLLKWA